MKDANAEGRQDTGCRFSFLDAFFVVLIFSLAVAMAGARAAAQQIAADEGFVCVQRAHSPYCKTRISLEHALRGKGGKEALGRRGKRGEKEGVIHRLEHPASSAGWLTLAMDASHGRATGAFFLFPFCHQTGRRWADDRTASAISASCCCCRRCQRDRGGPTPQVCMNLPSPRLFLSLSLLHHQTLMA
ncbi:uncharacterized protein J3D65DRAFT_162987 [Phyllosticta citribraziliensis]|uniref:Uncharacterized protein n=1 Tax=Phyllosticta citribraziliensis TaxID=989973 RepID=A0ABR1L3X7_9PEZI